MIDPDLILTGVAVGIGFGGATIGVLAHRDAQCWRRNLAIAERSEARLLRDNARLAGRLTAAGAALSAQSALSAQTRKRDARGRFLSATPTSTQDNATG